VNAADTDRANPGPDDYRLVSRAEAFHGAIFSVFTDEVELPDGSQVRRDWVSNLGAVVIVALDEQGRVALIRQYRQAVHETLWELPAGLLVEENPLQAAIRELAEEVDLVAGRWDHLVELHTSPGFTTEFLRIYLARDLSPVPAERRYVRDQEEKFIQLNMVDLDDAVAMVLRGEITNAGAVAGILAAARARDQQWRPLRPVSGA
jgi:ADP-ribose pyrophosphatase